VSEVVTDPPAPRTGLVVLTVSSGVLMATVDGRHLAAQTPTAVIA
jgi:hypothetical protein